MAGAEKRPVDLETLGGKIAQAKKLIVRLKQSNRELTDQLEAIKRRLDTQEPVTPSEPPQPSQERSVAAPETDAALLAEVERLRRERREIRDRVSRLLQRIDSLEI
jgi:predicted  nucleic acid-binding Zn-ribbon protein